MRFFIEQTPWGFENRPLRTWVDYRLTGARMDIMWTCLDQDPTSVVNQWNGPISQDSCVEFFFSTSAAPDLYFNLEANSAGILHMAHGADRHHRTFVSEDYLKSIEIINLIEGQKWTLNLSIDLTQLSQVTGIDISTKGICGNFHRCGGPGNPYQCWGKINTPEPDFHRPEFFKVLY